MNNVIFCTRRSNDLIKALRYSGYNPVVFQSVNDALKNAREASSILFLADKYPVSSFELTPSVIDEIKSRKIKAYVEYPLSINGKKTDEPKTIKYERAIIRNNFFNGNPAKNSICYINGCWYRSTDELSDISISLAKAAGYDSLAYEMPKDSIPVLGCLNNDRNILVCTTSLSSFIRGRYSPYLRWKGIWEGILKYFGLEINLNWQPDIDFMHKIDSNITKKDYVNAFKKNCKWSLENIILKMEDNAFAIEGYQSDISHDGRQYLRHSNRGDCNMETAMQLGLYGSYLKDPEILKTAKNIASNIYTHPWFANPDPESSMYGLTNWYEKGRAFYGDDNARVLLSSIILRNNLDFKDLDEYILKCAFGNLRTTGTLGFRRMRLDDGRFANTTWKDYYNEDFIHLSPHYQCYLWAAYLWIYKLTGVEELLTKSVNAIEMTMAAFPDELIWTNSLTAEIARMILPLCILYRITNKEEHRKWLERAVFGIIEYQQPCGAIRDGFKDVSKGRYPPPKSNDDYGTTEASLIQSNSDPATDLMYTTNWAFLGLHEASFILKDERVNKAYDLLADFLTRIQIKTNAQPYLDGSWMRGFDYSKWEYYSSAADIGWGAACVESGWCNTWISTVLYLKAYKKPVFTGSFDKELSEKAKRIYKEMITDRL